MGCSRFCFPSSNNKTKHVAQYEWYESSSSRPMASHSQRSLMPANHHVLKHSVLLVQTKIEAKRHARTQRCQTQRQPPTTHSRCHSSSHSEDQVQRHPPPHRHVRSMTYTKLKSKYLYITRRTVLFPLHHTWYGTSPGIHRVSINPGSPY